MDTIQSRIDRMHEGDLDQIIAGINSQNNLLVMNAVLAGANQRITDEAYIEGLRKALDNSVCLMDTPISSIAAAALHVLNVQKYTGHDPRILQLITSEFDF